MFIFITKDTMSSDKSNQFFSFNIAIKSNRYAPPNNLAQNGVDSCMGALMEEAKSMLEVGSYHENIVNLQGVTCLIENGTLHQVCVPSNF